jgi:DNA polymerase-3 subunit delta'
VGAPTTLRLNEVIGQERAVGTLTSAMETRRVHHAWVFCGPSGVGKFTTACAFAAELLRVAPVRLAAHPDFHVVVKELTPYVADVQARGRKQASIPVQVVREFLIEPAALSATLPAAPGALARKVFVLDEAEMLNPNGQNALLKTLEEPAEGTVIILITSEETGLLPTVRSRCQRVGFGPLDEASMERWARSANLPATGPERAWLVRHAAGSPGAMVRAAAAGLFAWHTALEPLLAPADRDGGQPDLDAANAIAAAVEAQAKAQADEGDNVSKDVANRRWAREMLAFLAARYSRLLRSGPAPERAAFALELIDEAERAIDANVRFPDVAEVFVARLGLGR